MGTAIKMPGGGKCKLLWENHQSGNYEFGTQNVAINLKGYDAVAIVFDPQPSNQSLESDMRFFYIGQGLTAVTFASFMDNNNIRRTITAVTDSYVGFGEAYVGQSNAAVKANNYGIPKKIWGVKF